MAAEDFDYWNPPSTQVNPGEFNFMAEEGQDFESSPSNVNAEFGGSPPPMEVFVNNFQYQLDDLKATCESIEVHLNSIKDFMAREELHQMQLNLDDSQDKLQWIKESTEGSMVSDRVQASNNDDEEVRRMEEEKRDGGDDGQRDEEEESCDIDDDTQSEASDFVITIVEPSPFFKESWFYDFFWSVPPPPSFAQYFDATRVVRPERGLIARTSESRSYLAKLEGVKNQDPWLVSFDAYHGRKPLFDEVRRLQQ